MKNTFRFDAITSDADTFNTFVRDRVLVSRIRRTVKHSSQSFFTGDTGTSIYPGLLVFRISTVLVHRQMGSRASLPSIEHSVFSVSATAETMIDGQDIVNLLRRDAAFAPQVDKVVPSITDDVAKELFTKYCFTKARANPTIGIIASAFMDHEHPIVIFDVDSSLTSGDVTVKSVTAVPLVKARRWVGLPPLPSKSEQESSTLPKTSHPNRKVPDEDLSVSPTTKRSKKSDSVIPPADPSGEEIDQLAMEVATAPLKASAEKTLSKARKKKCDKADTSISPTSKSVGTVKEIPLTPERCLRVQNDVDNRRRAHLKSEQEALKTMNEVFGPVISAGSVITTLINLSRENEAVADYLRFCFGKPKTK